MSGNFQTEEVAAVILAAGKGTRMKSGLTKLAHDLLGKPMVRYVAEACQKAGIERILVVVGYEAEQVKEALGEGFFQYILQREQLGTGHALMQTRQALRNYQGDLLVLVGDSPFLTEDIIRKLICRHQESRAAATFLTATFQDPPPYGRVVRDHSGKVLRIVEEKDAPSEIRNIREVNTSHYCFRANIVLPLLSEINCDNVQKEYYLTDIIEILAKEGHKVDTLEVEDPQLTLGINNRIELAQALQMFRQRILEGFMLSGVTVIDPRTTFVDSTVEVGSDTIIYPFTYLEKNTVIGPNCRIGPFARIANSRIGSGSRVEFSLVEGSKIKPTSKIGPFVHIVNRNSWSPKSRVMALLRKGKMKSTYLFGKQKRRKKFSHFKEIP